MNASCTQPSNVLLVTCPLRRPRLYALRTSPALSLRAWSTASPFGGKSWKTSVKSWGFGRRSFPEGESSAVESSWPSCPRGSPSLGQPFGSARMPPSRILSGPNSQFQTWEEALPPTWDVSGGAGTPGFAARRAQSNPVGHGLRRQCRNRPWRLSPQDSASRRAARGGAGWEGRDPESSAAVAAAAAEESRETGERPGGRWIHAGSLAAGARGGR